ncbi:unnamed protein product [Boreogadus saida]
MSTLQPDGLSSLNPQSSTRDPRNPPTSTLPQQVYQRDPELLRPPPRTPSPWTLTPAPWTLTPAPWTLTPAPGPSPQPLDPQLTPQKERVHGWAELLNLARYVTGRCASEEGSRGAGAGLRVQGPRWAQGPAPGTQGKQDSNICIACRKDLRLTLTTPKEPGKTAIVIGNPGNAFPHTRAMFLKADDSSVSDLRNLPKTLSDRRLRPELTSKWNNCSIWNCFQHSNDDLLSRSVH